MARVLDNVRKFFEETYEESGFYVYNVTKSKICFAKVGNKFADHWENLDDTDAELSAFVKASFAAEDKAEKVEKAKANVVKMGLKKPARLVRKGEVLKAAEPKKAEKAKAEKPKKAEKPDMTGAKEAGLWKVKGEWAQSNKGRFWKVTKKLDDGWEIVSHSGCKGRLTSKGKWLSVA
ncbi:MAG: hypothetical protein J6V90_08055 [Treponema sp.]|nr:hypothetical protein [Treponema sp.]